MYQKLIKLVLPIVIAGILSTGPARVQASQPNSQNSVIGVWTLVSETAHQGTKISEPLGPHPKGLVVFDRDGRFIMHIARPDIPKFGVNKRDAGTTEENKAVLAGTLAFFGTYSVSDSEKLLTLTAEASTFPNWIGIGQKRFFTLTGDDMVWTNYTPAIGAEVVNVVWRRVR